jgi:hypothetical protein
LKDWILGVIAVIAYRRANYHARRCDRLTSLARQANARAEYWSRVQRRADRVERSFGYEAQS